LKKKEKELLKGDGKDKAMRKAAQGAIVELSKVTPSSSLTSLNTYPALDEFGKTKVSVFNRAEIPEVMMLARNGALKGQPLEKETKNLIDQYNGLSEFVVGDMPNVDSQFIDYLDEIGAKYTIYHTGTVPRIKKEVTTQSSVKPTIDTSSSWSKLKNQPVYTEQGPNKTGIQNINIDDYIKNGEITYTDEEGKP